MTIKQHGGIFGRNPTFNNVIIDGTLSVDQIVEQTPAAGIALDGVTLKDGNVVLANGKGIDFSATAGAGTSELLDDYEEGVWTPQFLNIIAPTYVSRAGYYTKIGNLVHVYGHLEVSGLDNTDPSAICIDVPFVAARDYIFGGTFGHRKNANELFVSGNVGGIGFSNSGTQMRFIDTSSASAEPFFAYTVCLTAGELTFAATYETT